MLAKGICHPPLQILNSVPLTLDMALRKFRVENEALCDPRKYLEQVFRQIFSGTNFMILILEKLSKKLS